MLHVSPRRTLFLATGIALSFCGCTELPNDIGVRRHRSTAKQTRSASHHPIPSSWNDAAPTQGTSKIVINLTTQQAFFYRGGLLVGQTNISSGRRDFETPPGSYHVIQKDEHHVSSQYGSFIARSGSVLVRDADINKDPCPKGAHFEGAPMPYFLRFTGGYGMHAGFVPRYRASHGCIRMPEKMAKHFFDAASVGTRVEVVEPPLKVDTVAR
jgi:lipoprotein-anchoring transpeptidase ErfK/SrfK